MTEYIDIVDAGYRPGSYMRKQFLGYNLYKQFYYKELLIDVSSDKKIIRDQMVDFLHRKNMLSDEAFHIYYAGLNQLVGDMEGFFEESNESLYDCICSLRAGILDTDKEELYRIEVAKRRLADRCKEKAIDQTKVKIQLEEKKAEVLYIISDEMYWQQCMKDIERCIVQEKKVYLLLGKSAEEMKVRNKFHGMDITFINEYGKNSSIDFGKIGYYLELQEAIDRQRLFIMAYGEDTLMGIKDLKVPAIVRVIPEHLYARALTNVFTKGQECILYIPEQFNMQKNVPIVEMSRNSYTHMAGLSERFGIKVYLYSTDELYQRFPEEFINIYRIQNGYPEIWKKQLEKYPVLQGEHILKTREAIAAKMLKEQGIEYRQHYFRGAELKEDAVPWGSREFEDGILVSSVLFQERIQAEILCADGEKALSAREMAMNRRTENRLISNFLFFATPKIIENYNRLRDSRPLEQIDMLPGHIDYMLEKNKDGRRKETWPLYQKACIGMDDAGRFTFFYFKLGGGKIWIGSSLIKWEKGCVNTSEEVPIRVYTPSVSIPDSDESNRNYLVGEGRINFVLVGDRLVSIRQGEVMLPSFGVVISLAPQIGVELLRKLGAIETSDFYFILDENQVQVELDPPEGFTDEEWSRMCWVYGGAMSLIQHGSSVFPINEKADFLKEEGWMSPLSRQTQESSIHELEYHPRTAIGITEKEELFVMVISGRSKLSRGADYTEVCRIAKKLFPDTEYMINVDGGASSMLGLAVDGEFIELSMPAVSDKSCAGMARDISTMLCFNLNNHVQ